MDNYNSSLQYYLDYVPSYDFDALQPYISSSQNAQHYYNHYKVYISNVLTLIKEYSFLNDLSIREIIKETNRLIQDTHSYSSNMLHIYNFASQVWNHVFMWNSLAPINTSNNSIDVCDFIEKYNLDFEQIKSMLIKKGSFSFASCWMWLVMDKNIIDNNIYVIISQDASSAIIQDNITPLAVIDLWEHAYYLQYGADKMTYIKNCISLLNWEFICDNISNN